jgi:glucosylceramidase
LNENVTAERNDQPRSGKRRDTRAGDGRHKQDGWFVGIVVMLSVAVELAVALARAGWRLVNRTGRGARTARQPVSRATQAAPIPAVRPMRSETRPPRRPRPSIRPRLLAPLPRGGIALLWAVGGAGVVAVAAGLGIAGSGAATSNAVQVVQTSADLSQKLTRLPDLRLGGQLPRGMPVIHINDNVKYQQVQGFGAAMTDTSAWLIHDQLSDTDRATVLNDLYGASGIRLNFLRIPMGASDFTKDRRPYSYDELPKGQIDPHLTHFSIAHDQAYIIPSIRQLLAINPQTTTLANPWSSPSWMKGNQNLNNRMNGGTLLRSAYAPLARYFVQFIRAYTSAGIPIHKITATNEPTNPTRYPGMNIDAGSESRFIARYLRPALRHAGLTQKIYGNDLGWDSDAVTYVNTVISGQAAGDIAGIAWHCYAGEPGVMSTLKANRPRLDQIVDECTTGLVPEPSSEVVISTMRNWATAVVTWNIALDPHGGPVQPPNHGCPYCTGLMTINPATHHWRLGPGYYQLGQASAFVQKGARRIASEHFVTYSYKQSQRLWVNPGLDDVAFKNPDGSKVLIAYNNASRPMRFGVTWHNSAFTYMLAAGATATFVWDAQPKT